MWKYISRGLRAPFEKGTWTNLTSTAATDQSRGTVPVEKSQLPCPFRLVPCFIETIQRHFSQCGIQNSSNEEQKEKHKSSHSKSRTDESFHSKNINSQPCAILEAFGWSGVLVLGWTILQPWCKHENRRKPLTESEINPDAVKRYASIYKLLNPAFSLPVNNHVLPPRIAAINNDKQLQTTSTSPLSTPVLSPTSSESDSKTIEEAFDEAAEEVRRVHERAIGEAENRLGVACLSYKKNVEAVAHFHNALKLNHAPAAFNLGQCHELGIGTKQDFVQAAEYYKIASDMGHPSATYNLGVFYAHGWGGLTADSRKAKHLFLTAAALGQPEAQYALHLEMKRKQTATKSGKRIPDSFESRLALDFFKKSNIGVRFMSAEPGFDSFKQNGVSSEFRHPESSLPSSPGSSTASFSPPSSSSLLSTNDHQFIFNQDISTVDESSDDFSDVSSEDEWQNAIDLANINGNSATLYKLAVCYERNPTADPELVLHLYKMAAEHGHDKAKQQLKFLEEHYILGTLNEYLQNKRA